MHHRRLRLVQKKGRFDLFLKLDSFFFFKTFCTAFISVCLCVQTSESNLHKLCDNNIGAGLREIGTSRLTRIQNFGIVLYTFQF